MSIPALSNVVLYPSTGRLRSLPRAARHIMVIDDHHRYPGLLRANLNILHNYASDITILKSLGKALDELRVQCPDLLFVADVLRPGTTFGQIYRYVRQTGYAGPIIACTSDCSLEMRHRLVTDGATYVLDRGETHTASIIELLSCCLADAVDGTVPAGH
jgi:CheY-like chemotaxis protein